MAFDFPATPTINQIYTPAGSSISYIWNGTVWLVNSSAQTFMTWPAGIGIDFWGITEPPGSRFCYGQALSRTTFAALFAAISTTFGAGDGSTTFNLPDCRGRSVAGKDNMGGTSANRLTNLSGGLDGDILGATGGLETHVLTTAQLAAHSHTQQGSFQSGGFSANHTHAMAPGVITLAAGSGIGGGTALATQGSAPTAGVSVDHSHNTTISGATTSAGSDTAHNNVQPTIVCNKLITTGGVA